MANAAGGPLTQDSHPVSSDLIVSYDGTANDDDALALGQLLARTGASMALAYIRHSREFDPRREELAQHDAERRLEQGAAWLGDPSIPRHVVFSGSTGEGLEQLAEAEQASVIVFGSDYRTPPGRAEPGTSAQALADKLGAKIVDLGPPTIDLIVVGSQPNASARRITLSGATRTMLNAARGSVLVIPSGAPLQL